VTRTRDPQFRKLLLYPAELRGRHSLSNACGRPLIPRNDLASKQLPSSARNRPTSIPLGVKHRHLDGPPPPRTSLQGSPHTGRARARARGYLPDPSCGSPSRLATRGPAPVSGSSGTARFARCLGYSSRATVRLGASQQREISGLSATCAKRRLDPAVGRGGDMLQPDISTA
jgi:hypothetical protein